LKVTKANRNCAQDPYPLKSQGVKIMISKSYIDHRQATARFKKQASHLNRCARYMAAGSPSTPPNVLAALALDTLDQIKLRVAENTSTPVAILEQLAFDINAEVRLAAAENANAPGLLLEILAQDISDDVRFGIAENYKTPAAILGRLVHDSNPYVAWRAAKTLDGLLRQLPANA
jgi:hypothetical protein